MAAIARCWGVVLVRVRPRLQRHVCTPSFPLVDMRWHSIVLLLEVARHRRATSSLDMQRGAPQRGDVREYAALSICCA